ncbi:MAG: AAA family ATPase [Candidatus Sumerlaeia bacterium]
MSEIATPRIEKIDALRKNLRSVIRGKHQSIELLITALFANGSVLMEDVPGIGKTTLAKALAKSIDATFRRVQFTPDLLPGDILGGSIYNPVNGEFHFRRGPIFCNILLADEINRASPRTQSALLEAMSEMQATIEGETHLLPEPFLVIATQNPIEFHGTYPLPEAQLDRFLIQLDLGYPDHDTEAQILKDQAIQHPLEIIQPAMHQDDILQMQHEVRKVTIEENVRHYIVDIIEQTRCERRLRLGASPRGSLMLFRGAQAAAYIDGRDYITPNDVQFLAPHILSHRLIRKPKDKYAGTPTTHIVNDIIENIKVPV